MGALKANTGHLDNAAGLAGLIKALFVVREGVVPPVAGFTRLNPLLDAEDSPLYVPTAAAPWSGPEPRRAGVSSFGVGGTNAHAVVEAPPAPAPRSDAPDRPRAGYLALLSAADGEALARTAERLGRHLSAEPAPDPADVTRTLATARAALPERLAVAGGGTADLADRLLTGAGTVRGRVPDTGPAPSSSPSPARAPSAPAWPCRSPTPSRASPGPSPNASAPSSPASPPNSNGPCTNPRSPKRNSTAPGSPSPRSSPSSTPSPPPCAASAWYRGP